MPLVSRLFVFVVPLPSPHDNHVTMNFSTYKTADEPTKSSDSHRRSRGRPKRSTPESLRAALSFSVLKLVSGLSWTELERTYIRETNPARFRTMTRKPDAFLRYAKGRQVPRGRECEGSPVNWAVARYPNFSRWHTSPFFEALLLDEGRETLIQFTRDLWSQGRLCDDIIGQTMRKSALAAKRRLYVPIWSSPRDVVALRQVVDLDALCLILIALKANSGEPDERQCLLICAEWLQSWIEQSRPNEQLKNLMLQALGTSVPALARLFAGSPPWSTLKVDLTDPSVVQTSPIRTILLSPGTGTQ